MDAQLKYVDILCEQGWDVLGRRKKVVLVAQLSEWSLPTPEGTVSYPAIGHCLKNNINFCYLRNRQKDTGMCWDLNPGL